MRFDQYFHHTCSGLTLATIASTPGAQITNDPFPNPIPLGIVEATLEPFATVPFSNDDPARLQGVFSPEDGSDRFFVVDQRGPIYAISDDGATVTEYLDIRDFEPSLSGGGEFESGVQSMAFHPDFETNGLFYTIHGSDDLSPVPTFGRGVSPSIHQIVWEWAATNPTANTYTGPSPREVMRYDQPDFNHYGGGLAFDYTAPDGHTNHDMLFITIGDGTGAGDSFGLAQNTLRPNGNIFRINPMPSPPNDSYTVPSDNPFVGNAAGLDEIYAHGFRNPQRLSFDRLREITDPLVIDIGQGVIEELNIVPLGANAGWSDREGSFEFVNNSFVRINDTPPGLLPPAAEYDHSEGNAITGVVLARGSSAGALDGACLFGDIRNGRIFYIADFVEDVQGSTGGQDAIRELRLRDESGEVTTFLENLSFGPHFRADIRFGVNEAGELFATSKRDGFIYQLTDIQAVLPCAEADFAEPFAVLDAFDGAVFKDLLGAGDTAADLAPGGGFTDADVQAFDAAFTGGCTVD
ncbi:MAG: PQQ-dependent sugar dehydrogenase [Planctomycetota bacterium]